MSHLQSVECPACKMRFFHDGSIAGRAMPCPRCKAIIQIPADKKSHDDLPRQVRDDALGLECRIAGQAPVQAEGRIGGHRLYFRAKWSHWSFTVCINADIDPSCIDPKKDEDGFFQDGEYRGFYLSAEFFEASYMRYDIAEATIKDCGGRFVEAMAQAARNG